MRVIAEIEVDLKINLSSPTMKEIEDWMNEDLFGMSVVSVKKKPRKKLSHKKHLRSPKI